MGSIPFGVVKWLEFIWKADLPPYSKYLAAYLRTFMNDKSDMAWPSYSRMIHETNLSRSTIAKYLEVLEEHGWLVRDKGNTGKNTVYHAVIPSKVMSEMIESTSTCGELVNTKTSTSGELGSSCGELGVVRVANSNKQLNKQSNKQDSLLGEIVDLYLSILKENCNVKGVFKESFLNSKERVKPLLARIKENDEHKKPQFWKAYFENCSRISWVKDGINGEAVCTLDMLINKTKFNRNVEAFWA